MSINKKFFIVLEGIDGSGSTTQAELIKTYFEGKGEKAVVTSEPSPGPIGQLIRTAMKGRLLFSHDQKIFDKQMAYLFAADRYDHLYNDVDGVFPLIEKGYHVISTRYYFSSLAYHCKSSSEFPFVDSLNSEFPDPDLVVYLNNSVSESMRRLEQRGHKDAYENNNKLEIVKRNYLEIFRNYTGRFINIDATKSIQDIQQSILAAIEAES